jgi:hypothetical protein
MQRNDTFSFRHRYREPLHEAAQGCAARGPLPGKISTGKNPFIYLLSPNCIVNAV